MEDNMKWKTLKSEYLIQRPWLTARRDTVELPNGVVNDEYYVLEYPTWINVIALTTDGNMVMIRQYRHGIDQTCFEIVAGVCEKGEDPEAAARRELLEETGYAGGEWHELMVVSGNTSTTNNYYLALFITILYGGYCFLWLLTLLYMREPKTIYLRLCHWFVFLIICSLMAIGLT